MEESTQPPTDLSDDQLDANVWGKLIPNDSKWGIHKLTEKEYLLGRNETANIVLAGVKSISGNHLKLFRDSNVTFIQDLSTNGTFVDGKKLVKNKTQIIKSGSKIVIYKPPKKDKLTEREIHFIYLDMKEDAEERELGGPFAKYQFCQTLGSGAFATVRLGINRETNEKVAIKIIAKKSCVHNSDKKNVLMDEVDILKKIHHEGVVGIMEVYDTEKNLYLILELVTGGELFDYVVEKSKFTEAESRPLVKQMLVAINYLHSHGIAHRDLKLENILLRDEARDYCKISDFGLSRIIGDGAFMKTICGTPEYLAPEVLSNSPTGYGKGVDLWAMGVILYTMLFGKRPFEASAKANIFDAVKNGIFSFPKSPKISKEAEDIIYKMLTVNANNRITAEQSLEHAWVIGKKLPKNYKPVHPNKSSSKNNEEDDEEEEDSEEEESEEEEEEEEEEDDTSKSKQTNGKSAEEEKTEDKKENEKKRGRDELEEEDRDVKRKKVEKNESTEKINYDEEHDF